MNKTMFRIDLAANFVFAFCVAVVAHWIEGGGFATTFVSTIATLALINSIWVEWHLKGELERKKGAPDAR